MYDKTHTIAMKNSLRLRSRWGHSSTIAVIKPSMVQNCEQKMIISLLSDHQARAQNIRRKQVHYIPAEGMMGWRWGRFGKFIVRSQFFCVKRWVRGTVYYFLVVDVRYTQTAKIQHITALATAKDGPINSMYSCAPHKDVSVNEQPHIRRW